MKGIGAKSVGLKPLAHLCLMQIKPMTNPTPLSPAAQAVVTAIEKFDWEAGHFSRKNIWMLSREVTAAALRAAADQVVPKFWHEDNDIYGETMQDVRQNLLAIAAELEGAL